MVRYYYLLLAGEEQELARYRRQLQLRAYMRKDHIHSFPVQALVSRLKFTNKTFYHGSLENIRSIKEGQYLLSSSDLNFKEVGVY